jgi:hypothetical protein
MHTYEDLDDRFLTHWNQWYAAAAAGRIPEAYAFAQELRHFLCGEDGRVLIAETQLRIRHRKIHIPELRSFTDEISATFSSLKIFLADPTMVPEPLSEYLANMQTYMAMCRPRHGCLESQGCFGG